MTTHYISEHQSRVQLIRKIANDASIQIGDILKIETDSQRDTKHYLVVMIGGIKTISEELNNDWFNGGPPPLVIPVTNDDGTYGNGYYYALGDQKRIGVTEPEITAAMVEYNQAMAAPDGQAEELAGGGIAKRSRRSRSRRSRSSLLFIQIRHILQPVNIFRQFKIHREDRRQFIQLFGQICQTFIKPAIQNRRIFQFHRL